MDIMDIKTKISMIEYKLLEDENTFQRPIPSFWVSGTLYEEGDLVIVNGYSDIVYLCLIRNSDYPPDSNDWVKIDWYKAVFLRNSCYLKESLTIIKELLNAEAA